MSTYREVIYIIMDELKAKSDDVYFNESHVLFLLNRFRSFFLKKEYASLKKQISESAYQTICLDLHPSPLIPSLPCEAGVLLRSTRQIPDVMTIGNPMVYPVNYFVDHQITLIPRERMPHVGHNPFLRNIIYASLGPDHYLYLKSVNPQFAHLASVRFTAIFEDADKAATLTCGPTPCDLLDTPFPVEDAFIMPIVELVVNEILRPITTPDADLNNASDEKGLAGQPDQTKQPLNNQTETNEAKA